VLLAVIFCVGSDPDSPTGWRMEYSENISAVFSRISAIFEGRKPSRRYVSDGAMVRAKGVISSVQKD